MRRFFWWVYDLFCFPGWAIHPVLLFIVIPALLLIGAGVGIYFWLV
jgi:hypothetical protein